MPVKGWELLAILILVMTMEYVCAEQMLKVPSVTHVWLVTSTSHLVQVSDENLCPWHKMNNINYFPV